MVAYTGNMAVGMECGQISGRAGVKLTHREWVFFQRAINRDIIFYVLKAYYMPGRILASFHILFHLIFTIPSQGDIIIRILWIWKLSSQNLNIISQSQNYNPLVVISKICSGFSMLMISLNKKQ